MTLRLREVLAANLNRLMELNPALKGQKTLYLRSGVPTSTVGRIRRSEVDATIETVDKLAHAFRVTPAELLSPNLAKALASPPSAELVVQRLCELVSATPQVQRDELARVLNALTVAPDSTQLRQRLTGLLEPQPA